MSTTYLVILISKYLINNLNNCEYKIVVFKKVIKINFKCLSSIYALILHFVNVPLLSNVHLHNYN